MGACSATSRQTARTWAPSWCGPALALARRYPPDTARADGYGAIQRTAEEADAGMWAPDACGTGSAADVVVTELRLDVADSLAA